MRILCIHSSPFSFEATEQTKFAEKIEPPVVARAEAANALVAFVAAEKRDEPVIDLIIEKTAAEIRSVFENVGAQTVVIYPYSHLSSDLARPGKAQRILSGLRAAFLDCDLIACPFGWYKKFSLNGAGHPVSELSREITVDPREQGGRIMSAGKEHPVAAMSQKFREVFLELGLDEMINPAIVEESHVYKQYGPEAPLILDRVFYIAGLDRADIGLSRAKLDQIRTIAPGFDREDDLRALFREYKEAQIEADDFLEEMALRLKLDGALAAQILDSVFPEFKQLKPTPMKKTLRSHMTSNWFPVLQNLYGSWPLPVRVFSVGSRFRREQRQDPHHLFESTSASVAVMDKNLTMDDGASMVKDILARMGFSKCIFRKKKIASRYYDPDTDTEVFVKYQGGEIEGGNLGFYAPSALANYDIDIPIFNIGFGVERMVMILSGAQDLRSLVYPQFYEEKSFDDAEMARLLRPAKKPSDKTLTAALPDMIARATAAKDTAGPAEVTLFEGPVAGRQVKISAFNWDDGKPLLSMAALNKVFVHEANVYGLPPNRDAMGDKFSAVYDDGAAAGLTFLDLIISGFTADVEAAVSQNTPGPLEEKWKIAKRPFQVNLLIPDEAYDFIQRLHKNIKVGGPLFFGLRASW